MFREIIEMSRALKSPVILETDNHYYEQSPTAGGRPSPSNGGRTVVRRSAKRGSTEVLGDRRFLHMDQVPDLAAEIAEVF
jgi:hypothetical protein